MKAHTSHLLTLLCLVLCLGGCGFKGDLYLPNQPVATPVSGERAGGLSGSESQRNTRSVDAALDQGVQDAPNVPIP